MEEIDVRGLSCPQPVLTVLKEIKAIEKGRVIVRVDNETAKENVIRAIESQGWQVKVVKPEGRDWEIIIEKDQNGTI
ncbi:MAG: sulfurtransferase TusA family protein [Desulfobacterota bacterium]|nr:sulfurtransferase TusA family protein [Thermodesulfobacteriota bacterium]